MVLSLFRKSVATEHVHALYGAIVAQSRQPHFYAEWGVPDTVTGRFDMICVHMALVVRRLKAESAIARDFSQALFDLFFRDMDRSLREMGAGDLTVPKKIKKMTTMFYGLAAHLDAALQHEDQAALEAVLVRNIYGGEPTPAVSSLARYVIDEAHALTAQPAAELLAGKLGQGAAA